MPSLVDVSLARYRMVFVRCVRVQATSSKEPGIVERFPWCFRGARFERVAIAIQRRQEEREYHRLAALGLVPPGVSLSDYRDQLRSTSSKEDHQHHRDIHGN